MDLEISIYGLFLFEVDKICKLLFALEKLVSLRKNSSYFLSFSLLLIKEKKAVIVK